jgi:hypothetical protein
MHRAIASLILLFLLCPALITAQVPGPAQKADPHMTPQERARLIRLLDESEREYLDAISNLTEAQWTYKPSLFKWSVGQVAEHIMLTEPALFSFMERALAGNQDPDWESKTAKKADFLERVLPNRTGKAQAPREIQPTGKLSRDEVISRYKQARARTRDFAEHTELPLKAYEAQHPFPAFNILNAYDWLLYIPLHNIRHNKQIAEVKATPGYPK